MVDEMLVVDMTENSFREPSDLKGGEEANRRADVRQGLFGGLLGCICLWGFCHSGGNTKLQVSRQREEWCEKRMEAHDPKPAIGSF